MNFKERIEDLHDRINAQDARIRNIEDNKTVYINATPPYSFYAIGPHHYVVTHNESWMASTNSEYNATLIAKLLNANIGR